MNIETPKEEVKNEQADWNNALAEFIETVGTSFGIHCSQKLDLTAFATYRELLEKTHEKQAVNEMWPYLATAFYLGGLALKHDYKKTKLILPQERKLIIT